MGDGQARRGLAVSMLMTYRSTCDVIRAITRREENFAQSSGESERGELYAFQSDLARRLLKLLSGDFITAEAKRHGMGDSLPADLLYRILSGRKLHDLAPQLTADYAALIHNVVD